MYNSEDQIRKYVRKAISTVMERRRRVSTEEYRLRECIRPLLVSELKDLTSQEGELRGIIRRLMSEADDADDLSRARRSTGINALADIMKKLKADLEIAYMSLTTNADQRESFRDHILAAIEETLSTVMPYGIPEIEAESGEEPLSEAYDVKTDEIDTSETLLGDEPKGKEEEEITTEEKPTSEEFPELEGAERTGRNFAAETFARIEPTIVKAYKNLADPKDREDFYEYLLDNVEKYFTRFETAMTADLDSPEYAENIRDIEDGV